MKSLLLFIFMFTAFTPVGLAADGSPTPAGNANAIEMVQTHANYLWTLVAACLVFFMQAGFALVESGFTRAKNSINIMMKNLMDFSMGTLAFWAVGFGLMFGATGTGLFGTTGFFLSGFSLDGDPWVLAFWMFQVVFAATAATIVSGAMAERTKFSGYLIYSAVVSGLIYPIFGSWAWGGLMGGTSLGVIGVQLLGIAACFGWTFVIAFVMFKTIAATVGLRVSAEEEMEGLDFSEHGGSAYPDFEVLSHSGIGISGGTGGKGMGSVSAPKPVAGLASYK